MSIDIDLLLEEKIFKYDMNEIEERTGRESDIHFVVIGAGGTGGYLIPNLGRMVGIKNKEGSEHTVTIIDADNVEEKNLLRQNFSPNDIGKNKAEVMATRYGRAFGETFYYLAEYIETAEQVKQVINQERKTTVIIDCVDNNKTRFILKEGIRQYHETVDGNRNNTIMISSGNEEYAGQIVFSYKIGKYAEFYRENLALRSESPDLIDIFPDMNIGLLPDEESCAERAVSAPQNIATNMTAADIIFGYVNKLLNKVPIDTLVYFFDSRTMIRKAYSGRKTHVEELLRLVEGNENLPVFIYNEKWSGVDIVKAPTYEEVLSSSLEVDAIVERAAELDEETAQEEGLEGFTYNGEFYTREEFIAYVDTLLEHFQYNGTEFEIANSSGSNLNGLLRLLTTNNIISPQTINDFMGLWENSFNEIVDNLVDGPGNYSTESDYGVWTPDSGFPSSILDEEEYHVYLSVIDLPEIAIQESVIDEISCSSMTFDDELIIENIPGGIIYYAEETLGEIKVVATSDINQYLTTAGENILMTESETSTVVDEINTSSESARISGSLTSEPDFTFMGRTFNRELFRQQIDNNFSIYNNDSRDLGVRDVAADNLTSIIDELIALSIIESESIEDFEGSWMNYSNVIMDEIIDAHIATQDDFEPVQMPLGFDFDEDSDAVNFNLGELERSLNSSFPDRVEGEWRGLGTIASSSHTILGPDEIEVCPGRYSLLEVYTKLRERKLALEIYIGEDLNEFEFTVSTGVLSHVEEAISEIVNMMLSTPEVHITIMDGGLKHEGVVVLPALNRNNEITLDDEFDEDYILSNYQSESYDVLNFTEVLEDVAEEYVKITLALINESIPQDEMPKADEVRNYITNLILSINNYEGNETTVKINNHGAWIGLEQIMGIEINDIYNIRSDYRGVDVSIISQPQQGPYFREGIHGASISTTISDSYNGSAETNYWDLGPGIYKIEVVAYGLMKLLDKEIDEGVISSDNVLEIESRRQQFIQLSEIYRNDEFRYVRLTGPLRSIARSNSGNALEYNLIADLSPDERYDYIEINLP